MVLQLPAFVTRTTKKFNERYSLDAIDEDAEELLSPLGSPKSPSALAYEKATLRSDEATYCPRELPTAVTRSPIAGENSQ